MQVYRISRRIYSKDLSGIGAGLYGGRWNSKGINLVYTTGSISLACMEYLVHNIHIMGSDQICLSKIEINKEAEIAQLEAKFLPQDWNEKTYLPISTQQIGTQFCESNEHYILKVPSVIVPDEFNYLLNPMHSLHQKTKITEQIDPFTMDERLFK